MKHRIDWDRGELQFSYQSRYKRHRVSIVLPAEVLSELSEEYGPLPEIPARYDVTTGVPHEKWTRG
jgi:hypothetical protein